MIYPQILLGLVASVSAIDAYFHLGQNCDGPRILCTNLNPGVCCTASASNTVGYRGIPTDWVITAEAFTGGGCKNFSARGRAQNTNFICIYPAPGGGPFTGTKYSFTSRKRDGVEGTCAAAEEAAGKCSSSQKPNELHLADGTKYNIVDLEQDLLEELVCSAFPSTRFA